MAHKVKVYVPYIGHLDVKSLCRQTNTRLQDYGIFTWIRDVMVYVTVIIN